MQVVSIAPAQPRVDDPHNRPALRSANRQGLDLWSCPLSQAGLLERGLDSSLQAGHAAMR